MIKILTVSGSPVEDSSTDILLREIEAGIIEKLGTPEKVKTTFVKLNDLRYIPCQACGEAPTPEYCFFDDDLTKVYAELAVCDCLLVGSPIYFDTVSAQLKAFMDRCNCIRPADFNNVDSKHDFLRLIRHKRPGATVLAIRSVSFPASRGCSIMCWCRRPCWRGLAWSAGVLCTGRVTARPGFRWRRSSKGLRQESLFIGPG